MSTIEQILADRERVVPAVGYHLVGLDDFEEPDQMLYVVGWFPTQAAAEAAMIARLAAEPGEVLHIYGAES